MSHLGTEKIDLTRIPLFRGVEDGAFGDAGDWVFYLALVQIFEPGMAAPLRWPGGFMRRAQHSRLQAQFGL